MKAPKRDTQRKAASAARRSAEGPVTSSRPKKPARKEKAHAPVAAPAAPRKLKPAPPVTDCAKCGKLAESRGEARRLRRALADVERLLAAGGHGCLPITDEQLAETLRTVAGQDLALAAAQPGKTLRAGNSSHSEKLAAAKIVKEWLLGGDKQRLEHSVKAEYDLSRLTDDEVATLEVLLLKATPEGA
jgi:hypothetical protein